jgi:hypothetical protein
MRSCTKGIFAILTKMILDYICLHGLHIVTYKCKLQLKLIYKI